MSVKNYLVPCLGATASTNSHNSHFVAHVSRALAPSQDRHGRRRQVGVRTTEKPTLVGLRGMLLKTTVEGVEVKEDEGGKKKEGNMHSIGYATPKMENAKPEIVPDTDDISITHNA